MEASCHWGALGRKNQEKHFIFFLRQSEDLIPPKIKRSNRCDTTFMPKNKTDFFFDRHNVIIQVYCDELLGSTDCNPLGNIFSEVLEKTKIEKNQ